MELTFHQSHDEVPVPRWTRQLRMLVGVLPLAGAAVGLSGAQAHAQCAGPAVLPVINGVVPGSAPPGATVVIQVMWNGVGACLEKVTFGGTKSPFAIWDGLLTVEAIVPNRAAGSAPIVVDMFIGGPSDPFPFQITGGGAVAVVRVRETATATGTVDITIRRAADDSLVDDGSFSVNLGDPAAASAERAVAAIQQDGLGEGLVSVLDAEDGRIVVSSTESMAFSVCPGLVACPPNAGFELPPDQLVLGQVWALAVAAVPGFPAWALLLLCLLLLGAGLVATSVSKRSNRVMSPKGDASR